jgi:hypothetical protein
MDPFEASKPDRFHHSLSSAWASFLGAQHCSHDVSALRKALEEHIEQTKLSISSLQSDVVSRHDLLATAVAESKSKLEQHTAELEEAAAFQNGLSSFQKEINDDRKDASMKVAELARQVQTEQEGLDGLRLSTSQDIWTAQEQYRLVLEKVDSLQAELREARQERMGSEQKLAALQSQIKTMTQPAHEISEDSIRLLGEIISRRDELIKLLDTQRMIISSECIEPYSQTGVLVSKDMAPDDPLPTSGAHTVEQNSVRFNNPPISTKRTLNDPLQPHPKRPAPSTRPSQDIRSLYLVFCDRYKSDPPKSDTAFIWEFLSRIEDPAMSKHIQDSLAAILPEHVTPSRDTRRRDPRRHVDISKGLTWRKFREALVRIPGPP